ncbi:hypothetical protein [Mesorhizobium sp. CN2-181]|uniref:hypothetical protein n=1 Tax=Mesorhizobium yinganensis TaxID=3157707 RepID=UPI0032B86A14
MAALLERSRVQAAARKAGSEARFHRVTVDGQEYDALPHEIILLDAGRSPDDLGLKPVGN